MGAETQTTPATPTNPSNETATLAAAVEQAIHAELEAEAIKTETAKAERLTAENAAATEEQPAEAAPTEAAPAADENVPALEKILRAREKAREERVKGQQEASNFLENAKKQAQEEADRIIREARERADAETRSKLERLRTKPLEAIGDIGWSREQLVEEVATAGTPQYQMMKRLEARAEAAEKKLTEFDSRWADAQKRNEESQRVYAQQVRQQVERDFLALTTDALAPHLRMLHDDADIVRLAHATADRLRAEAGHEATKEEIRDYLEHQAKARVAKIRGESPQPNGTKSAPATASKGTEKKPAAAPRMISAASQSERRATPKTAPQFSSSREEYEKLKEIAEAAMKEEPAPKT
jgi:hypothetical protein